MKCVMWSLQEEIGKLFKSIIHQKKIPSERKNDTLIPIFKKGEKNISQELQRDHPDKNHTKYINKSNIGETKYSHTPERRTNVVKQLGSYISCNSNLQQAV